MKSAGWVKCVETVCVGALLAGCLWCILQPMVADGAALRADTGQAGAWTVFYRYGSVGVVGLWMAALLLPQRWIHRLPDMAAWMLMGMVIWETVVALEQLYGERLSNHALYRFTGTFLNPGPFCGFIAMGMPLALHVLMDVDKRETGMSGESESRLPQWMERLVCRAAKMIAYLTLLLCLLLLPAGMSRSAWVAATVGCVAVVMMHRWERCREWWRVFRRSRKRQMAVLLLAVGCVTAGWGAFNLKRESANGRLFMWKIASLVIAERPWTGYGGEGFQAAFARRQERYFAAGNGTDGERYVAGTPEHAFNEYLTTTVKYGVGGVLLMVAIGGTALACAWRMRAYGIAASLLAVAVFAWSSYPLQLPDFGSAVAVLVVVPICTYCREWAVRTSGKRGRHRWLAALLVSAVLAVPFVWWRMKQAARWQMRDEAAQAWSLARTLYNIKAYETVCKDYALLYERMGWNDDYLFEYGRALHYAERYEESMKILKEAEAVCGDPMILNLCGKNHEAMGEYDLAARCYQQAYDRVPSRLYPLYLLMEMYASPACGKKEKAKEVAQTIVKTKEKVPSQAVEDMKRRAKEILQGGD